MSYLHIFSPTATYFLFIRHFLNPTNQQSNGENKCMTKHRLYFNSLREKTRQNDNIFIFTLCLVLLCLSIKMIGAVERVNKYNTGRLFSYFRAVLLKYCLVYNFQLYKSYQLLNISLIELSRLSTFSKKQASGETFFLAQKTFF